MDVGHRTQFDMLVSLNIFPGIAKKNQKHVNTKTDRSRMRLTSFHPDFDSSLFLFSPASNKSFYEIKNINYNFPSENWL